MKALKRFDVEIGWIAMAVQLVASVSLGADGKTGASALMAAAAFFMALYAADREVAKAKRGRS